MTYFFLQRLKSQKKGGYGEIGRRYGLKLD